MTTQAVQDYLKAIFKLQQGDGVATTSAIAERLGISTPSVTGMLKKLVEQGYVTHTRYQRIALTEAGRKEALGVIRLHRLIERYLHDRLGFSWDQVDAEAERLEHAVSPALAEALARALNDPAEDPHGDPIPTQSGELLEVWFAPLSAVEIGATVRIRRVRDRDPEMLRYLGKLGMYPGAVLTVLERLPFDGACVIQLGGSRHTPSQQVCDSVFVEPVGTPAGLLP